MAKASPSALPASDGDGADLPAPLDGGPSLAPVTPPAGSPDAQRRGGGIDPPGPARADLAAPPAAPAPAEHNVAVLDFLAGTPRHETVSLSWPFRHDGEAVHEVVVRRLSTAEVGAVADRLVEAGADTIDLYEIYAAMTGLPAPVLRGLDADDGERVIAACRRLFPAALAPLAASATPATG